MLSEFGNSYCIVILLLVDWQKNSMVLCLSSDWVSVVAKSEYDHEWSHFYWTTLKYTFHLIEQALSFLFSEC